MPVRVQHDPKCPWDDAVYIGRPTRWGNPFMHHRREIAVDAYRLWVTGEMGIGQILRDYHGLRIAQNINLSTILTDFPSWFQENIHQLRGQNLACWCPLDGKPCHGDVLLKLANT